MKRLIAIVIFLAIFIVPVAYGASNILVDYYSIGVQLIYVDNEPVEYELFERWIHLADGSVQKNTVQNMAIELN